MEPHTTNRVEEREARVRHRAYLLWLAEGQPGDSAEEHWRIASEAEDESEYADANHDPSRAKGSAQRAL